MRWLTALVRPVGAALLALFITTAPAQAQTFTWTGGGGGGADPNWSNADNWGGTPLVSDLNNTFLVMTGNQQALTSNLDIVGFNANSLTFDAGAGQFIIGGGNTLTLGTGGITNLSANAQQINTPVALGASQSWTNNGTGLLLINANTTVGANVLTIDGSGNTTFSATPDIIGTAGLTKQGTGTLTLQGTKTYTGVTNIIAGEVVFTGTSSLGATGALNNTVVSGGATLTIGNNGINPAETLTLNGLGVGGVGALRKIGTTNSNTSAPITILSATRINSDTTGLFTISGAIGAGGNAVTLGGTGNMTVTSVITTSGTFTKDGTGLLTLSGNNSAAMSGPIAVTGGILSYTLNTSLGTNAGTVTLNNNGTLRTTNTGNGGSFINAARGLVIDANGGTVDFATTISANSSIYAGTITGTGILTKTGIGEFRYQGAGTPNSTYSKLVVNQGLFRIGNATGSSEVGFGAVPGSPTADAITLNGGGIGVSLTLTLNANRGITLGANGGTLDMGGAPLTIPSVISGVGNLTRYGTQLLTLSGANTYTGSTSIANGTLSVSSLADGGIASGIGSSSNAAGNLVLSGGTLLYTGPAASTDRLFSITAAGGTLNSSGTGPVTFTNTGSILATDKAATTLAVTNASTAVTIAPGGTVADLVGVAVGMTVTGTGIPAGTTVTALTSSAGSAGASGLTLSAAATATGTPSLTFGSLNRTLTLTGTNTDANTISGVLANPSSTTLALTKAGAGTWVLTGANTYTGATTINAGTLRIGTGGSLAAGSAVAVNNNATLEGTGTVNGAVSVAAGGTIRGGTAGVGTLTLGNGLATVATSNLGLRVTDASPTPAAEGSGGSTIGSLPNPTSNNFLNITAGSTTINAGIQILVDGTGSPFNPAQTYSYQIASGAGNQSGLNITTQSQFTPVGFTDSFTFSLTGNAGGAVFLNIAPVPEPATVLGLAAGALGLGGFIRRRKLRRA